MKASRIALGLLPLFSLVWHAPTDPGPTPVPPAHEARADCAHCHTCADPSLGRLCLRECSRHEHSARLSPELGPDVVVLGELADLYVPVRFDHRTHAVMAGMAGGCETCHHYTPPDSAHPACKGCHPAEILHEDLSQPGLKGAYHRRCLSCHAAWDSDTACEICHEKRKGGRLRGTATEVREHSHYEPVPLKELIVFSTTFRPGDRVPFHHRNHSRLYERDCTECHRQQSCTRCHVQGGEELHPMGEPASGSLHETCFRCHEGQRCRDCHGRDPGDLFVHTTTGWPLKAYHASLPCRSCHGRVGPFRKLDRKCEACHSGGWPAKAFDHRITGVALDAVHREAECESCHTQGPGSPPRCDGCHDDGRAFDASKGFRGK